MSSKDFETGRCLCSSVKYKTTGAPKWIGHCHCKSCRRNTGSALATFVGFTPEQVEFILGERAFYQSSPGVKRGFCKNCGTPISYESERWGDQIHLYLSTLNNPEDFKPTFHSFYEERISWFDTKDDLPRYTKTSNE